MILRDGSSSQVHVARPEECGALTAFFERLSPESRRQRFFSAALPSPELIASFCDCTDPRRHTTLIVTRAFGETSQIIATASYAETSDQTAEVSFAVDDAFHGKGIGTLLLERLALLAVRHGFTRFWAVTHADNQAMRDVFRESGFAFEESPDRSEVEVNLSIVPSESTLARLDLRHRVATVASLRPFFRPAAIAVVGASRNPASVGYRLLQSIIQGGFPGSIYPVNPKADEILGLRAFPTVAELPTPPDLAVVVVPASAVLNVVDDCARRGVRAVIVITAGFAEVGAEGKELQGLLIKKIRDHGMRLIGPNCLGLLSLAGGTQLNAMFVPVFPPAGRVAMSSDSGGLGLAVLATAARLKLGVSSCVSVGNRADVSTNDLLEYWEEDDETKVILLYLESFGNPRRFARIARRVSRTKPIVAVKAGRTKGGSRAAGSHTAALAANDVAVDALFRQTGVIRAESLEELFDLSAALATQPLPTGRRVAVITNAGGPAILCADACEAAGLSIVELSQFVRIRLASFLPTTASLGNPVDMIATATPADYARAIQTVRRSDEVDALIVIYLVAGVASAADVTQAIQSAIADIREHGKAEQPVLVCLMPDQSGLTLDSREKNSIPCYAFPEAAARVLGKMACYAEWRAKPLGSVSNFPDMDLHAARRICQDVLSRRGDGWLAVEETRTVLEHAGSPVSTGEVARTVDEAAAIASKLGYPVAVKLASSKLVHKTEVGGVRLNLPDESAVRQAFESIRGRLASDGKLDAMDGVLIQPMMTSGTEVMIGMTQDPVFGPLIAFGLGGIHVEILGDVCFRVTPLTDCDAAEMVRGIRGYRLFQGYRGHPPADVAMIEQLLLRISKLVEEVSEIVELDLNPVFAFEPGRGCRIVDARIRVAANS